MLGMPYWRPLAVSLLVLFGMSSCGLFRGHREPKKDPEGLRAEGLGDYRLSAGKVVYLDIYESGRSTMAADLVVDAAGNLLVPEVGEASVDGMTPLDAAKKIEFLARRSGQNHLSGPRVHVKALDRRAVVHVSGHVRRPGPVIFYRGLTVAEAIAAAGGADEDANPGSVGLTSAGRKKIITTPETRELEEGDVVEVPRRL
jgi:protein involved in polysaccharide export with SLBB domain